MSYCHTFYFSSLTDFIAKVHSLHFIRKSDRMLITLHCELNASAYRYMHKIIIGRISSPSKIIGV